MGDVYSCQQLYESFPLEASIQPVTHVIPIPYELATDPRLEPNDPRTWIILASYATVESSKVSAEFDSPGFETLARLCNCSIHTVRRSVQRLSGDFGYDSPRGDNWIRLLPSEPGGPLRIELTIPKPEIVYRDSASRVEIPHAEKVGGKPDSGDSLVRPCVEGSVPTFSHPLIAFAASIRLKNPDGQWFDIPPIELLHESSGFAVEAELRKGLQRLKQYQDRKQPVSTPIALWRSMFAEGKFIMNRTTVASRSLKTSGASYDQVPASTREERRQAAMDLAKGITVEIGKLHPKLRATLQEKDALIIRGGVHCELKPDMELIYELATDTFRVDIVSRTTGEISHE